MSSGKSQGVGMDIRQTHRRNWDESMLIDNFRSAGQYLWLSGHPDELRFRYNTPLSLHTVRENMTRKTHGNEWLLRSHHFNTNGITKRQQFKGPSDEIHYPIAQMGSNWYNKAVQTSRPYLTRILPWTMPGDSAKPLPPQATGLLIPQNNITGTSRAPHTVKGNMIVNL